MKERHYGPIWQCRTHRMSRDCGGELPDCVIEKMLMEQPTFRLTTQEET